jgi:hypothetical protein
MGWRPSTDRSIAGSNSSLFWRSMETIWDVVSDLSPLARDNWTALSENYISVRRNERDFDSETVVRRLPKAFWKYRLGSAEIDAIDVIVNMKGTRASLLEGPRGAGKTSMLHYVEAIVGQCCTVEPVSFLIIDGLQLADYGSTYEEPARAEDYASVIRAALLREAGKLRGADSKAFEVVANKLSLDLTQIGVREAFRDLGTTFMENNRRHIVVSFDNLDHLDAGYIKIALNLARLITSVTKFSCLLCLRPNLADELMGGRDARAFFSFRIAVSAVDIGAWMDSLGDRAATEAQRMLDRGMESPEVLNSILSPDSIKSAFKRFNQIITVDKYNRSRSPQDDAIAILNAIASDDNRQFQILVRRILRDWRLPTAFLIGQTDDWDFHPIGALLEGGRTIFKHDKFVPNLLTFERELGNPDFLVAQRILLFLDRKENTPLSQLYAWMGILGYGKDVVLDVLIELAGPLVIRGSDSDRLSKDQPPKGVTLTEAGYYYRDYFLSNADYLTSVVLDVALEHDALRKLLDDDPDRVRGGKFFGARALSLAEYTRLALERESAQVFRILTSAAPSSELRRVADALRNNGLLTKSLLRGLQVILDRGTSTTEPSLLKAFDEINDQIPSIQQGIDRIERRLVELVNRGRKIQIPPEEKVFKIDNAGVSMFTRSRGDETEATAALSLSSSDVLALVAVHTNIQGKRVVQSTVALPNVIAASNNKRGTVDASAIFTLPAHERTPEVSHLGKMEIVRTANRMLFLALNERDGLAQLSLHKLSNGAREELLGPPVDINKLEAVSRRLFTQISARCLNGSLKLRYIKEAGAELARLVLNENGANRLASLLHAHERVIIHSAEEKWIVPWEWLCPWAIGADAVEPLAKGRHAVRWLGSQFDAAATIYHWRSPRPVQSLCTIGLGTDSARPWRIATPGEPEDLAALSSQYDVLHIVGHWNEDERTIEIAGPSCEKLSLSCATLQTVSIGMPNMSVILSVCDLGRLSRADNPAVTIAELRPAAVWTPVASILEPDAARLDDDLGAYVAEKTPATPTIPRGLGEFFRRQRERDAWAYVYVRYSL